MREPDGDESELVLTAEDSLARVGTGMPIRLERDAAGRVRALVAAGTRFERR